MEATFKLISEVDFLVFIFITAGVLCTTSSVLVIYKFLFTNPEGMTFLQFFRYHYDSEQRVKRDISESGEQMNREIKSYFKVELLKQTDLIIKELKELADKIDEQNEQS